MQAQALSRLTPYERKFSDFLFLLAASRDEYVVVHHPEILGNDYDELVESLNRIAFARKKLIIVPPDERRS